MRWLGAAVVAAALGLAGDASAQAPAPTLSASDRLAERRAVVAGTRAYAVGTEDGGFPAMGFHTRGEMGGIWTPPLKLLDGLWLGLGDPAAPHWIGPARRFISGYGHVIYELPDTDGVVLRRVDVVPDGRRGMLVGLRVRSPGQARTVTISVDAHSELMGVYPWGESKPRQKGFNLADTAGVDGGRLEFQERGRPPVRNADDHDWAAVVGAAATPVAATTGDGFRGPVSRPVRCGLSGPKAPKAPRRCDDTAYGKGRGGRLSYALSVPANASRTLWIAVAGSDQGIDAARAEHAALLADPEGALAAKIAGRQALATHTRLELPADPQLAQAIDWSKQNLADSVQEAQGLRVRETRAGKRYPRPEGRVDRVRYLGAGWPDYPWLFATDGEYTAFASVALGQFEPIQDHLRALRDVSVIDNGRSGKVVHEVMSDGSVYFGSNADAGNTDESAKFPSAVALVWRWTGDDAFRDDLYPFARAAIEHVVRRLDADDDGWPEGLGNVEREGMGEEKLDNATALIRGLYDLAELARSKGDRATARRSLRRADRLAARFEAAWWMPRAPGYADSLRGRRNRGVYQRHWIGVTPMEIELTRAGRAIPGLATPAHARRALALRERRCYADDFGLFHTGGPGCDPIRSAVPPERQAFTLNTAIMAVAEGNYGRLGDAGQRRFTRANARLQLPQPDEQPGAMPEIAPSPLNGRSINRPLNERPMVLQAWGAYGTAWPVVHQQLGVRPELGFGRLDVVPQVPPGGAPISGRDIRLGRDGAVDVAARASGRRYSTTVTARLPVRLRIGVTLPHGTSVGSAALDGEAVVVTERATHRGLEVTATTSPGAEHTLVVVGG